MGQVALPILHHTAGILGERAQLVSMIQHVRKLLGVVEREASLMLIKIAWQKVVADLLGSIFHHSTAMKGL